MSTLSLRIATSKEDVLKVLVVRGIVFIEEQQVDWDGEIDEFERTATHFLGEVDGQPVATGRFGADMQVSLTNDGPVTFWLES